MSGVKPCIHGRNFCLECHASLTEQELKAKLDAALAREAALRESLSDKREEYNKLGDRYDALQQRLTVSEQRAAEFEGLLHMSKELLTTISRHGVTTKPNDWCDSFKAEVSDRIEKIEAALKPYEAVEAGLSARPAGCCCPPKDHTGIWAAAMCPVHFGLRRNLGVK